MKPAVIGLVSVCLAVVVSGGCGAQPDDGDGGGGDSDGGGNPACVAPVVPPLAEIPDDPVLAPADSNVIVAFEVDGDTIVGKYAADAASGQAALKLWQELVLRIPANQRMDLVEFRVFTSSDPAGFTSGTTGSATGRYGYVLAFTSEYFNQREPCDPLTPRRGNYSWTLIHEYSHMRSVIDGTLDLFTSPDTNGFGSYPAGDGSGYPDDGSPDLTRDFVTSYAERSAADEDYAESFTTYVMLATLPDGDTGAAKKVRFFEQHGFAELRKAIRVTEPDGSASPIAAAPRDTFPFVLTPPSWILGTWQGVSSDGLAIEYVFTADNIVIEETPTGGATTTKSYQDLRDGGVLATIDPFDNNETSYGYHVSVAGDGRTEYHYRQSATELHTDIDGVGGVDFTRVTD